MRSAHKGRITVLVVVSLLGLVGTGINGGPVRAAAPAVGLVIDSEVGDPLGAGDQEQFLVTDGKLFFSDSTAGTFTFMMGGSPTCGTNPAMCDWVVTVGLPTGSDWGDVVAPATFLGAEKTATAEHAMLDVVKGSTDCDAVAGRFTIDSVTPTTNVVTEEVIGASAMVARFEQHCDGADPALHGMFSFGGDSDDPWYSRTVTPAALDFEGVRMGETKNLTLTLTKRAESDTIPTPAGFTITGAGAGAYSIVTNPCSATPLSASCVITLKFAPTDDIAYNAKLTWTDQLSPGGRDVNLTGQGTSSELTVTGGPVLFGEVRAGTFSEPLEVTLSNAGTEDVSIGTPTVTGAHPSAFAIDDGCNDTTLAQGASCVIQVVAYPTAPLLRQAALTFDHDATVGPASTPLRATGTGGYYIAEIDGAVTEFGDAVHMGDMDDFDVELNAPMLGITTTSDGDGYWMVGSDGGIFAFNAPFHGSTGGMQLNAPVLDMESAVDDSGYWMAASDGGVFAFKAPFHGSMGGKPLNAPVVGIAVVPDGSGYWLVASDGGIFAFNAAFKGSMGGKPLNSPIVGMAPTANGQGYWMVAEDGGVFAFNAPFFGSAGGQDLSAPVVAIEPSPTGNGYWLLQADGVVHFFGDAADYGDLFELTDGQAVSLGMAGTAPPVRPAGAAGYFS